MNEVGWFLKYFWGLSYSKSSRSSLCLTHASKTSRDCDSSRKSDTSLGHADKHHLMWWKKAKGIFVSVSVV
jgi:hypothetical protein